MVYRTEISQNREIPRHHMIMGEVDGETRNHVFHEFPLFVVGKSTACKDARLRPILIYRDNSPAPSTVFL